MTDHGFRKDVVATSMDAVEGSAEEISKIPGVVAVHVVRKVPGGELSWIILSDKVKDLDPVVERIYKRHSIKPPTPPEIWISRFSYRNGKRAMEAFV